MQIVKPENWFRWIDRLLNIGNDPSTGIRFRQMENGRVLHADATPSAVTECRVWQSGLCTAPAAFRSRFALLHDFRRYSRAFVFTDATVRALLAGCCLREQTAESRCIKRNLLVHPRKR
jgi:hypothetical protein